MTTRSMTSGMIRSCNEKERTVAEAERLCGRLGPGWTPEVWNNFGWCYRAVFNNLIYVCRSGKCDGTYFCMLGRHGSMIAHLAPEHVQGRDPRVVVQRTLAGYREKWEKFRAEQEAIVSAGDECAKGWQTRRTSARNTFPRRSGTYAARSATATGTGSSLSTDNNKPNQEGE